LALNTRFGQLILWILCLISPIGSGQNDDRHGTFHLADDRELFLTQGVIIRETHSEGLEKSPLLAVAYSDAIHHLYDPNTYSVEAIWSGRFGKVKENVPMPSFATILSERDMDKLIEYFENP
jgi:hypothetical protein